MSPRAATALLVAGLAAWFGGCAYLSSSPSPFESRPGPYDRLDQVRPEEIAEVQRLREEDRPDTARAWVARLAEREPSNLPLACLRQDVELEAGGAAALASERERAGAALETSRDDPVALLLAARVEADATRARSLLESALGLAPESAWTHYALAHLEARQGRWAQAAERLERALLLDPGNLWARRLQTQLLVRGGPRDEALEALERWLVSAAPSPFFRREELDAARLDLAHELLLDGRSEAASEVLAALDPRTLRGARAQQVGAAIQQAERQPEAALDSARLAQAADPTDPLSLVQQAMLEEEWLGDPSAARVHWKQVLEATSGRSELGALLLSLRARAALERLGDEPPSVDPPVERRP